MVQRMSRWHVRSGLWARACEKRAKLALIPVYTARLLSLSSSPSRSPPSHRGRLAGKVLRRMIMWQAWKEG